MFVRLKQLIVLTRLTAIETARQPICLLLTLACTGATIVTPLIYVHNLGEGTKLARDGALAFHFMFGMFVAGYAACSALAREIRGGTAAAVLAKPVSRGMFFLAKYLGVLVVVGLFSITAALATLLSARVAAAFGLRIDEPNDLHTAWIALACPLVACLIAGWLNYARRRSFQATAYLLIPVSMLAALLLAACFDAAGHWAPFATRVDWRILPASALVMLALSTLAAIAVTLSARLPPAPVILLTVGVLALGLVSDYLFGRHTATHLGARLGYVLTPNWQHFWMADALLDQGRIPWRYVGAAGLYAALYSSAMLCAGTLLFRQSDVA
jgi:hypothetical protein